jgi:SpoVK/Ycf46/Vps4 family AAA+-type ATPase
MSKELKIPLIPIRISDVVRGEIGSGEKAVIKIFEDAKKSAPCIIFIDEFQAVFTSREHNDDNNVGSTLSSTLASCFDSIVSWNNNTGGESLITVIASTNEPWSIDIGFLREGRLGRKILIGPLDKAGRIEFLENSMIDLIRRITTSNPTNNDTDNTNIINSSNNNSIKEINKNNWIEEIASLTNGYTGADLTLLVQRTCLLMFNQQKLLTNSISNNEENSINLTSLVPTKDHFLSVINGENCISFQPSVTKRDMKKFIKWNIKTK